MADITMCEKGVDCPLKEHCYRYNAPVNKYRQSYFQVPPYDSESGDCDYYWLDKKKQDGKI
jgi:hypothetical protein